MTWTRGVLAAVAIAGVAFVATRPDDEAQYLGDFPSIQESAEQPPAPAPVDPPVVRAPTPASTVTPPRVSSPEAPAGGPGYTGGLRGNPGPGSDTTVRFSPPGFEGDDVGPGPGDPAYAPVPPPPVCADDFVRPGIGLISCATGEVLGPVPVLPPLGTPVG